MCETWDFNYFSNTIINWTCWNIDEYDTKKPKKYLKLIKKIITRPPQVKNKKKQNWFKELIYIKFMKWCRYVLHLISVRTVHQTLTNYWNMMNTLYRDARRTQTRKWFDVKLCVWNIHESMDHHFATKMYVTGHYYQ